MAPAQGRHEQIEKCKHFYYTLLLLLSVSLLYIYIYIYIYTHIEQGCPILLIFFAACGYKQQTNQPRETSRRTTLRSVSCLRSPWVDFLFKWKYLERYRIHKHNTTIMFQRISFEEEIPSRGSQARKNILSCGQFSY